MINDEQILLKTAQLLENFDISDKKPENLLREISEDEYEVVSDLLDDLDGQNLAFDELFDGKMRKIIDFPTMDNESELGQFAEELKRVLGLTIDWEKGMVSAQREWTENSIENDDATIDFLMNPGGENPIKKANRKFQMKIGKYFAKLDKLLQDYKKMRQIIAEKVYGESNMSANWGVSFSIGQIKDSLSTDELKRLYQIQNGLELYAGTDSISPLQRYYTGYEESQAGKHTKMPELAKYWQENAGYIKKNLKNLEKDTYSIIITRYPVDVMRMADFNNIISCHSPKSRDASAGFFKCAVAEARGHGALAYVVETDKLLEITDSESIEAAEGKIQEGEIFADETRGSHIGLYHPKLELLPVSRIRLRQMRYYDTDTPKRWDEGTELAVPEQRVYGSGIPGLYDRVRTWAEENQEKAIENMPKDGESVNLDRFYIFGGSYEDTSGTTGRKKLLSRLTQIETDAMVGNIRQNEDTEGDIDANFILGIQTQWENEIEQITEEWTDRYAAVVVQAWVHEDGDGGLYIDARWDIVLDWDMDEFARLPNSYPTAPEAAYYLNDYYGDLFDPEHAFLNKTTINSEDKVRWGCRLNLSHPQVLGDEGIYDPEVLNEACMSIDTNIDDKRDAYTATLEEFFKQNMWMEGGEYIKLATEIEDSPYESYEWDVRYDGEHPTESYEATAAISHDFNAKELGLDPRILFQILDSRDWRLAVRTALIASAQKALGTEYHLDIENSQAVDSGEDITYTLTFQITADDPDERVKLFRELTTGEDSDMDDEDNIKAAFNNVMAQFLNSRQPSHMQQNLDERLVRTWKGFLGR